MAKLHSLRCLLLASVAGLLTSCSTVSRDTPAGVARFHEGTSANVVVRFYGWNSMQMIWPDTRENGFLPLLDRAGVARELSRPGLGRNLAVVVVGHLYTPDQEAQMFHDWTALLTGPGFQRLIFLRAGSNSSIDGLIIVHDSAIAQANDERRKVVASVAALPAATRADVANSSGHSIR